MIDGTTVHTGGNVIAFPPRRADVGQERLDRALAGLILATQEQAAAVATWRIALAELDHTMGGLAESDRREGGGMRADCATGRGQPRRLILSPMDRGERR